MMSRNFLRRVSEPWICTDVTVNPGAYLAPLLSPLPCSRRCSSCSNSPMPSAVSLISRLVVDYNYFTVPLLLDIFATTSHVYSPTQHSLLVISVSWLFLYFFAVFRVGVSLGTYSQQRQTAWFAGAFLGLSHICDRAACDKVGIWATKVNPRYHVKRIMFF